MKIRSFIIGLAAALFTLAATATASLAIPATAKSPVNVRTGPGVNYARVDTLTQNELVNVTECRGNWCFVEHEGANGWVSKNYLNQNVAVQPTPTSPNVNVTIGGPSFSVTIGTSRPHAAPVFPKICFYNGPNYTGQRACINAGTSDNKITGYWNDKISSIQLQAGTAIQVCRNWYYRGFCQTYHSSMPHLNGFLNDQVSSYNSSR